MKILKITLTPLLGLMVWITWALSIPVFILAVFGAIEDSSGASIPTLNVWAVIAVIDISAYLLYKLAFKFL